MRAASRHVDREPGTQKKGELKMEQTNNQTLQKDPTNLLASKGVYFYLFIYLFIYLIGL